jgi:hypothetical protein
MEIKTPFKGNTASAMEKGENDHKRHLKNVGPRMHLDPGLFVACT